MNKALYSSILIAFVLCSAAVSAATFKETTNNVLDNTVSGTFGQLTSKIFNTVNLSLDNVIIMYVLFIVVLFILLEVMHLVPFFENRIIAFVVSVIVSLLIAISGAYASITIFLFGMLDSTMGDKNGWKLVILIISIFILVIPYIILSQVLKRVKAWEEKSKIELAGFKVSSNADLAKTYLKMFKGE